MSLVAYTYEITAKYPEHEKYELRAHTRKSSVSIPSNIAEGTSRLSYPDKIRFIQMSYASLMEAFTQVLIAHRLQYLPDNEVLEYRNRVSELSNKLNSLKKSFDGKIK